MTDDTSSYEERAAILEYDAGMTREDAERMAAELEDKLNEETQP